MPSVRLALGLDIALMILLASCAVRARARFAADDARDGRDRGCLEPRSASAGSADAETEAHDEVPDPTCAVDLGHVDIAGHTDDQRLTIARQLYEEGDAALRRGDARLALQKFEEGYAYAHERHVFNFNIGQVALELQCCQRARDAFQRFLALVPEHRARAEAREKLALIEIRGCARR